MDTGFAQVLSAILGAIASIIVAVIAGYFTVKAAQVKAAEKTNTEVKTADPVSPKLKPAWLTWSIYALLCGVISMLLAFALAYTGNSLSGVPTLIVVGDSTDPALVSGILSIVGFLLGIWAKGVGLGKGRILLLFFIICVFSPPVAYSLAYTGNWLDGVPASLLFHDSLDSLIVGSIMCAVSFLVGVFVYSSRSKNI